MSLSINFTDTIAAVATGGAVSAIGIVRISGPNALTAVDNVFEAICGTRMENARDRLLYYGRLRDSDGELIDLCLCAVSRAPNSYTGEDTAELQCHGSPVVLSEALRVLSERGVRQAAPGEFTRRAFLNGRMDLTQAEAVIDLIEAETPLAARNAAGQLGGAVSSKMDGIYNRLIDIMAHFHAFVDYPDEDIDDFDVSGYLDTIRECESALRRLLDTHERGKVLLRGIPTAIVGRTNTGKSSLLNALLGYERAIVTDIAGTTRDTVEEKVLLCGVLLRLIDTAGLRETSDAVEMLGVERSLAALGGAGLVLAVFDGSEGLRGDDYRVLEAVSSVSKDVPCIAVINKSDLPQYGGGGAVDGGGGGVGGGGCAVDGGDGGVDGGGGAVDGGGGTVGGGGCAVCREVAAHFASCPNRSTVTLPIVALSARTGEGLQLLSDEVSRVFPVLPDGFTGGIITSARQADAIGRAAACLKYAATALTDKVSPDAALMDLESALSAIGEVTGKTMREDIVSRIFERFCVGK